METCKFIMMIGIPGSGKSTLAKNLSERMGISIFSSDEYRARLLGDENDQRSQDLIFTTLYRDIENCISRGRNVIYDATNLRRKHRAALMNRLNKYPVNKTAIIVATPIETCYQFNRMRSREVPEDVIRTMATHFEVPSKAEGFDDIKIVYPDRLDKDELFDRLDKLDQHSVYHEFTVGEHCRRTADSFFNLLIAEENLSVDELSEYDQLSIRTVGLYHDIGKEYTFSQDEKGGHFYGHEGVSAYLSLMLDSDTLDVETLLWRARMIQDHMRPFNDPDCTSKYMKDLDKRDPAFMMELLLLHEADIKSQKN